MAAINAGTRRQRGLFGLLCGTISIKKSVMCIGDSSVAENDVAERSPSWTQPEVAEVPAVVPAPVAIPSPVLVSKKLAEEAVAKRRNVRFRHHGTVIEEEEENDIESASSSMTGAANNEKLLVESKPTINRRPRQKKMAPAPPLPAIIAS